MWWGEILGNGKGNTSETKLFQHYCFLWFSMFQSIHNSIENFTKLHSISQYAIMFLLQKIIACLQVFQMSIKQHQISKWMKTPYRWRWRGGGKERGGAGGERKRNLTKRLQTSAMIFLTAALTSLRPTTFGYWKLIFKWIYYHNSNNLVSIAPVFQWFKGANYK